MFSRVMGAVALVLGLGLGVESASAITINGEDYQRFLSVESDFNFGYWPQNRKYFTYEKKGNTPIPVDVNSIDSDLPNLEVTEIYSMGTTTSGNFNTDLKTGIVKIIGENGINLLTAQYSNDGHISTVRKKGRAGQLDMEGLFRPISGVYYNRGFITDPIFVQFAFDTIWHLNRKDVVARGGTLNFYSRGNGGETEVPEPGTVALLLAGLLGAKQTRRNKS